MLELVGSGVWDFWLADTGTQWHLFFLHAPRSLRDPRRRHAHASVGHAVSRDLRTWEVLRGNALGPGQPGDFDETATWTGSIVRDDDGVWRMFYTGMSARSGGHVQRIGSAVSRDLVRWRKLRDNPLIAPDPRWYERLGDSAWPGDAWRDPWVFPDPGGDGWHMLLTARANGGPVDNRGVIGHARSIDLVHWEANAPLSSPGAGFGHLEVPQIAVVAGQPLLVFSCGRPDLGGARATQGGPGGIWTVPASSPCGPFDTVQATLLADERLYAGRLVEDRAGRSVLLGFLDHDADSRFVGAISDPIPVGWRDGRLVRT